MIKKTMPYNHINKKIHHSHVFLILSIKLLNVNLEKILKSEQFLTDKGNLLNSYAASSWNVPDSIFCLYFFPRSRSVYQRFL